MSFDCVKNIESFMKVFAASAMFDLRVSQNSESEVAFIRKIFVTAKNCNI